MSDAEAAPSPDLEPYQTQFDPDGEGELWEVVEIVAEKGKKYFVKWAGVDKSTGKPWPNSWVFKKDTTDDLILEWKRKQEAKKRGKSGATKTRGSSSSSKAPNRVGSTSTTSTTRRTRQSIVDASVSPARTRLPPTAPDSRPSPTASPEISPTTRKRRRDLHPSYNTEVEIPIAGPSRPRKRRKLEVEVVRPPSRHSSAELRSSYEAVGPKKLRTTPVGRQQAPEEDGEPSSKPDGYKDRGQSSSVARKRKVARADEFKEEVVDEEEHIAYAVPTTKVGPPRHLKRRRETAPAPQTSSEQTHNSYTPNRQTLRAKRIEKAPPRQCTTPPDRKSRPKVSASGLSNGNKGKGPSKSNSSSRAFMSSKRPSLESSSDDGAEEEEASRLYKTLNVPGPRSSYLAFETRRLLMQEEEESTQEAAAILPSPPPNPFLSPVSHGQRAVSPELELEPELESEEGPVPSPSKPAQRHGRPFANDTFSRLGIVPETQATEAQQEALDELPYDPTQHDLVSDFDILRTPVRRAKGTTSRPGSASLISKMKSKRNGKLKELQPIPQLSPSAFRPYLPQEDEIGDFSSPEKETHRMRHDAQPLTQDTIEDFTQDIDMDHFMDWDGGAQRPAESSDSVHDNGPDLSLGPELPPPDAKGGPRQAMNQVLSKEEPHRDVPVSPEVPASLELPPTSTTQRADADGVSQQPSIRSSQIAELNAILEEKDEKLTQLECQVEELQTRITELENENAEGRATFDTELGALRAESGEKAEQITLLENQLVELQLQLTQLIADNENQHAQHQSQIRELNESLEERNEQVSQLEGALVELQVEVEAIEAEKEKLAMAQQQHSAAQEDDARDKEQLETLQQRLSALEEELAGARRQHEEEAAVLSGRLKETSQDYEVRVKAIEDDRDLLRKLYDDASSHAQRLARENVELEEGRQRAEGRAQAGVAMVKATFTAQVVALRAEVERLTALVKVLKDKDERTNDEVRARAAREPELQEENAELKRENMEIRRKVEKMLIIGTATNWAEDDGEDEDYVPDPEDGGSPSSSSSSSDSDGDDSASLISVRESVSLSPPDGEGCYFVCQNVSEGYLCNKTFMAAEDVIKHANDTHYHCVQMSGF